MNLWMSLLINFVFALVKYLFICMYMYFCPYNEVFNDHFHEFSNDEKTHEHFNNIIELIINEWFNHIIILLRFIRKWTSLSLMKNMMSKIINIINFINNSVIVLLWFIGQFMNLFIEDFYEFIFSFINEFDSTCV